MPPSTLDRPRTRAQAADWVVVVPGQPPHDETAPPPPTAAAPQARDAVTRYAGAAPWPRPLPHIALDPALQSALGRVGLLVAMVCASVALLGLVTGRDPLLALGLKTPHFVAYQGASTEQVHFVMDDGWSLTAAAPGAMLMDWREGQAQPAVRLTMGNPAAVPEVETMSADGSRIEEIRYRSAWPGVDAVIRTMPGGWAANMIVEPGVSPGIIELEYVGATSLAVDGAGRLHVRNASGAWIEGTPESWQDGLSGREPVASSYELRGGNRVGFVVGPYDPSRPLVVDPPSERSW
ncbi:MAG: hypothetical protein IT306_24090 [Chloroflexi bacterium]|nr:hypothetical protein [Chloroflexota bacterium]